MKQRNANVVIAVLLSLSSSLSDANVEIYQVDIPTPQLPIVTYTLNCQADVTIEILPSNQQGDPTGLPVKTESLSDQSRGKHTYLWPARKDDDTMAVPGTYVIRIKATARRGQWGPIAGLYVHTDWDTEQPSWPLPYAPTNIEGFYGIGISKNPRNPYYGRIYVTHVAQKDILMYDPDGSFVGEMDDTGIEWKKSAPWDLAVADDGFVYVADRTAECVYCFPPDGSCWLSKSPSVAFCRAMFARTEPNGLTHVYVTGNEQVQEITVDADHTTWGERRPIYRTGRDPTVNSTHVFGLWVSPDRTYLYQCYIPEEGCPNNGVTKWRLANSSKDPYARPHDGSYIRDQWQNAGIGPAIDIELSADGDFLWVTRAINMELGKRTLTQVDAATGTLLEDDFGIVRYATMCATDAVGNIALTFGKDARSRGQLYWGLFSLPGVTTAAKVAGVVSLSDDPPPAVVTGSATWKGNRPGDFDKLLPYDTCSLSFRVADLNGWNDVGAVTLDLTSLGYGVVPVDSIVQDTSDANHLTTICTKKGITAAKGAKCGMHRITITCVDRDSGYSRLTTSDINLAVGGYRVAGKVKLIPKGCPVAGALLVAEGGLPGAPGYPFRYESRFSDSYGRVTVDLSEGLYKLSAQKEGCHSVSIIDLDISRELFSGLPELTVGNMFLKASGDAESDSMR